MAITIEAWKKSLEVIAKEITDAAHFDDVYWQVNAIVETNPEINKPNIFLDWLMFSYVDSITVRVRRLTDKDRRTISLWRLLEDMKKIQPAIASKAEINTKQEELVNALRCVEEYTNTLIAHRSKDTSQTELTFADVRLTLVSAFKVFNWCASKTNTHWATAVPVITENWLPIFKVPWLNELTAPKYVHLDEFLR